MSFGVDEDWQRLTPAQLLAAGRTFVIGYVSEDGTGKNITKAEVDAYLAAGVAVLLVYEYSVTAVAGGSTKGTRDAGIAVAGARALGYPAGCVIAFAVDQDTSANPAAIDAYCRAFTAAVHTAGYRSMVYGGYSTVRYCLDQGVVDLGWQTYAWSAGRWDPRAVIRQVQNVVTIADRKVDLDTAMVNDFGAWTPGGIMALRDDPDGLWLYPRVEAIAQVRPPAEGPEKGQDLPVLKWMRDVQANAAKAAAGVQVTLSDEQLDTLAQKVAVLLGPVLASPAAVASAVIDEQARRLGNG